MSYLEERRRIWASIEAAADTVLKGIARVKPVMTEYSDEAIEEAINVVWREIAKLKQQVTLPEGGPFRQGAPPGPGPATVRDALEARMEAIVAASEGGMGVYGYTPLFAKDLTPLLEEGARRAYRAGWEVGNDARLANSDEGVAAFLAVLREG